MPSFEKVLAAILLITALGFFVHRDAPKHDFVSWDDDINLYANPNFISGDIRWTLPWVEPYQGLWIPVTYTAWGAISAATRQRVALGSYELVPAPYHAAGLILHLVNTALVLLLLLRWLPESLRQRRILAATLGALLFCLHPIQVEAVHWATGLKDTLSACLALACLVLVPTAPKEFNWRTPVSWLLLALALAAKPSVVVVPVVWLLFSIAHDGRPKLWSWIHFAGLFGLAAMAAIVARLAQPIESAPGEFSFFQHAWVALDSLGFYILQVIVPRSFCPDYGRTPEWVLEQGLTAVTMVGIAYLTICGFLALFRKWRLLAFMFVFPVVLSPVLGLISFGHQSISTVTDRYAYIAMIVPAYLLARWVTMPRLGRFWPLCAGALSLLAASSLAAAKHWQNTNAIWENVLAVNPNSHSAWTNLGYQFELQGQNEQALEYYERAIEASPANALAYNNIGNIHFRAGQLDLADRNYRRARIASPSDLHSRNNLGAVYQQRGQLEQAEALFKEVLQLNPHFAPAFNNLGLVQIENGNFDQAERLFRSALDIDPGYRSVLHRLAKLLAKRGEDMEARQLLSRAIGFGEHQMEFALAWSKLLKASDRPRSDIRQAQSTAADLGCRDPDLLVELGHELVMSGELVSAAGILQLAKQVASDQIEPRLDLAIVLETNGSWQAYRSLILETARDFPFYPEAWQNVAIYQLHNGDNEKAEAAINTAQRLQPNFEFRPGLLQELDDKTR